MLGPTKIPFLGTLIQVGMADPTSYIGLDKLSKKYGDLMSIKLGFVDAGNWKNENKKIKMLKKFKIDVQ